MEPDIMQQPEVAQPGVLGDTAPEKTPTELETRLDALIEARLDAVLARQRQAERDSLMRRFVADHPDFTELAANGALEAQKRSNPLLDDVGAYLAHQLMTERQAHDEALATAREEAGAQAESRTMERLRTKRLAKTLGAEPAGAGRGQGLDPDLAAPEQFGGLNAVLASRLTARRKTAGN